MVRQVVNVEAVLHGNSLRHLGRFHDGYVGAFLPGLAKYVALARCKIGFINVAGGNGTVQVTRIKQRHREASCVQGRNAGSIARRTGKRVFRCASRCEIQGNDWICDSVIDAVESASDGSGVINDAVGLSALKDDGALDGPAICDFAGKGGSRKELGEFIVIVDVDNMRAVEVRRSITISQIERVVAVIEEAQSALLVQRARERVGNARRKPVTEPLFDVRLESIVGRYSGSCVQLRLTSVADVRDTLIDVSAFGIELHRLRRLPVSSGQHQGTT